MDSDRTEQALRVQVVTELMRIVADQAKVRPDTVEPHGDLRDEIGLRSLDMLLLRETVERTFGVFVTDEEMAQVRTIAHLTQLVMGGQKRTPEAPSAEAQGALPGPPGSVLRRDGTLQTDIEISMQLLGLNGLAETPLLMRVADLRWQHMAAVAQIMTRDVVDADGDRLYAAVFFAESCFPPSRPMGTFIENDRLSVVSTLARYGTTLLDGQHYIFPLDADPATKKAPSGSADAAAKGIPWVRISNSFVKKWDGAAWLKKSRPAAEGFARIRELAEAPTSHGEAIAIRDGARVFEVPPSYDALTKEPVVVPYDISPDRDMNGAGLVYFAVYPAIMDYAERRILGDLGPRSFTDDLIDRRTLVHRKIAYFSNAPARDTVLATVQLHIENPFRSGAPDPEMEPIRLIEEIRLHRQSDGRHMATAGAKKIVLGVPIGETKLAAVLAER